MSLDVKAIIEKASELCQGDKDLMVEYLANVVFNDAAAMEFWRVKAMAYRDDLEATEKRWHGGVK